MASQVEALVEGLQFPEAPRWRDGSLWFSDMYARQVMRLDADGALTEVVALDDSPSGLGFLPDGRLLVVSMHDRRLLRLDADGLHVAAELSEYATWHCNDMVVDRQGRAYVGNFGSATPPGEPIEPADIVLVEPDGSVRVVAEGLLFPNGAAITPDGGTLVIAETRADPGRLTTFAIAADGGLSDRRVLFEFAHELPDGICLDEQLGVWVASPFSHEVIRIDRDGRVGSRLAVENPYAVALGGSDGRDLYVCTADTWVPEEAARLRSGAIRRLRVDIPAA
jgi:sugar lactone lactonase YvrE